MRRDKRDWKTAGGGGWWWVLLVTLLAVAIAGHGCGLAQDEPDSPPPGNNRGIPNEAVPASTTVPAPAIPEDHEVDYITITVVGDLLMHMPLVNAARIPQAQTATTTTSPEYDFSPLFSEVAAELKRGTFTIANLETTLGGPERGYSGYPRFNTPDALLDALQQSGVTTLITANNHAMDTGAAGLKRTLSKIREQGLEGVGTRLTADEPPYLLLESSSFKVALLAYTYGTNGIPVPEPHLVSLIDEDGIAEDIAAARTREPDLLLVAMHWGNEYERYPNEEQQRLARFLHQLGVDAVLGTHPHVVQPVEIIDSPGTLENPAHSTVVLYSTGNFVSNQRWRYSDSGTIFHLVYKKTMWPDGTAQVSLEQLDYTPVWVHKFHEDGRNRFRILPLYQQTFSDGTTYRLSKYRLSKDDSERMRQVWEEQQELLGPPPIYATDATSGNSLADHPSTATDTYLAP